MLSRTRFVMGLASLIAIAALIVFTGSQAQQLTSPKQDGSFPDLITSVPRTMSYQGVLNDSNGDPVRNTTLNVTFRIFDALVGGNQLPWTEVVQVTTDQRGNFTAILSNLNLPFDVDYYLELQIEDDPQPLEPRHKLHMVPYSARTDTSDFAFSSLGGGGWVDDGTTVRLETTSDNVGIGTTTPDEKLEVDGSAHVTGNLTVDGSINPSSLRAYDSGWFAFTAEQTYIFTHNFGTTKVIWNVYFSPNSDGSNAVVLERGAFWDWCQCGGAYRAGGWNLVDITSAQVKLRTKSHVVTYIDSNGNIYEFNSGYFRILGLALE